MERIPADVPSRAEFVDAWVPRLPQARHVAADDAARWHASVVQHDPSRFRWHFARLHGIGGSEIGEIVAEVTGQYALGESPREIWRAKLLRIPIKTQNRDMRRGTYLEPIIDRMFREDYNAAPREDLEQLINASRFANHPWVRNNVDRCAQLAALTAVVDYKCPREAKPSVPFNYAVQVLQYDLSLANAGRENLTEIKPGADLRLVVQYQHEEGSVVPVQVPFVPELATTMLEAGDAFWQCVLDGKEPKRSKKPGIKFLPEPTPEEQEQLNAIADRWVRHKVLADQAYIQTKRLEGELNSVARRLGINGHAAVRKILPLATAVLYKGFDEERLEKIIEISGVEADDLKSPSDKYDTEAMVAKLRAMNVDPELFRVLEFDEEKILKFCEANEYRPPYEETLGLQLKPGKKIQALTLDALKGQALRHVTETVEHLNLPAPAVKGSGRRASKGPAQEDAFATDQTPRQ